MDKEQTTAASTDRFERKKEAIIAAAAGVINRGGVKGMTLADVAASLYLITTSVTYYFKKKEDLAVACFLSSIERFDVLVSAAMGAPDPRERLLRFLKLYLELTQRTRRAEEAPVAVFANIRALRDPHQKQVADAYNKLFRRVRALLQDHPDQLDRHIANARTHIVLEQVWWSQNWRARYETDDYELSG